jgi:lysophospholipid acyltransferase (LPLAT)-like uncharacterized protein
VKEGLRYRLAGTVGGLALDALVGSARFDVIGEQNFLEHHGPGRIGVIFTLWHGRLLPLTYHHRNQDIVALISQSADGEYIARVTRHWGYDVVRGSSSRGGAASLRELVRHGRAGRSLAFTADGPRGPREKLKPGVIAAAQLTGQPIVPMAGMADRAWWFEGWDRFLVPKPFARIRVAYEDPIFIPRTSDEAEVGHWVDVVEAGINRATARVENADT